MNKSLITVLTTAVFLISCNNDIKKEKIVNEKRSMNILLIAVDDLRPELNFYRAHHIQSPNLDNLAAESLVFNSAYCNIPVCGASRDSLLTDMRPIRERFIDYSSRTDVDAIVL